MTTAETHIDIYDPSMDTRARLGDAVIQAAQLRVVTMQEAKAFLEAAEVPEIVTSKPYDRLTRSRILMELGSKATQVFRRVDKRSAQSGVLLGFTGSINSRILPASRSMMEGNRKVQAQARAGGIPPADMLDILATKDVSLLYAERPLQGVGDDSDDENKRVPRISKANMRVLMNENAEYLTPEERHILETFIAAGTIPKAADLMGVTQKQFKATIDSIRNKYS